MNINFQKILDNKILVYSVITIFSIITFIIVKILSSNSFILGEDTSLIATSIDLWIKQPTNCNYIASSVDTILGSILPRLFDVHPSDFLSDNFCYIQFPIIISLVFILCSFLFKDVKKNYFYAISFILMISFIFKYTQFNPFVFFQYECFFRVFFQVTIWLLLLLLLVRNVQNKSKIYYFLIPFTTFIVCISKEPMCVSTLVFLFAYSIVLFFNKEEKETFKTILLSFCLSIISFIIFFKLGAFLRKTPPETIIDEQYFFNVLKTIPEFSLQYIRDLFFKHLIAYTVFFTQIIVLLPKIKEDKNLKHILKIIGCFLFGTYVFFLSLILIGKYRYTSEYCTSHEDLQLFYSFLLLSLNLILLNFLIKYDILKKHIISIIFILLIFILNFQNYNFYNIALNDIKKFKIMTYKAEKILRLASIKNKPAFLDKKILSWSYLYTLYLEDNFYIKFLNQFENKENQIKENYIFADEFTVEIEFKNNGGTFTREELENIKFDNLLHNRFLEQ